MSVGTTTFKDNLGALRTAQKPSHGTPAYSRLVNRPAGRVVAALAYSRGLSPDVITATSAITTAAGLAVLAWAAPSWPAGLAVSVLLAVGYVLDSTDGQLARLRGGGSLRGEWLDHTVDCVKVASIHLAVAISWYRFPPDDAGWLLLVPLGFSVVQVTTYFGLILMPQLRARHGVVRSAGRTEENPARKWLILPTDYGFQLWTFVLLGTGMLFVGVYAALFVLAAAMLALALAKWWRELGALDARDLVSEVR